MSELRPPPRRTAAGRRLAAPAAACLALAACAQPPAPASDRLSRADGAPSRQGVQARRVVGAPYRIGSRYVPADQPGYDTVGVASWYGTAYAGRRTADGERFDPRALSGAHPTLPLPSWVEVTDLENGRSLRVRLNDRGAFRPGRIVDLSQAAAERLGFAARGTARVRVRWLGPASLDSAGDAPPTPDLAWGVRRPDAPPPL